MNSQNKINSTEDSSQFLSGELTEKYLNDSEMDAIVGGGNLKGGTVQVAKSATTLDCWHECTVSLSGCKKLTT